MGKLKRSIRFCPNNSSVYCATDVMTSQLHCSLWMDCFVLCYGWYFLYIHPVHLWFCCYHIIWWCLYPSLSVALPSWSWWIMLCLVQSSLQLLASFPGLPQLQFLMACSMQKRSQKAWWILPLITLTVSLNLIAYEGFWVKFSDVQGVFEQF